MPPKYLDTYELINNSLVVGSSPTSSTTQLPTTGEPCLVQKFGEGQLNHYASAFFGRSMPWRLA